MYCHCPYAVATCQHVGDIRDARKQQEQRLSLSPMSIALAARPYPRSQPNLQYTVLTALSAVRTTNLSTIPHPPRTQTQSSRAPHGGRYADKHRRTSSLLEPDWTRPALALTKVQPVGASDRGAAGPEGSATSARTMRQERLHSSLNAQPFALSFPALQASKPDSGEPERSGA
ncbi:hypothetical protein GY45DRAFT_207809 [Cubamyces sp. BRFM 1775]|nr:hypothetical protein GY45DRAFT_207809 [Cubamyces sp. BRFM 1775]